MITRINVVRNVVYMIEVTMFRAVMLTLCMTANLTKENQSRHKIYF